MVSFNTDCTAAAESSLISAAFAWPTEKTTEAEIAAMHAISP
jgi:hypothetical protein